MQQFRGLTARAPYFANGSARDLTELVDFFDRRFKIGLTDKEKEFVEYDMADYIKEEKPGIVGSPAKDPKASAYFSTRRSQRQSLQSEQLKS